MTTRNFFTLPRQQMERRMCANDDEHVVSCLIRRINTIAQLVQPEDLGIVFVGTPRCPSQLHALKRVRETAKRWGARNELSTVTFSVRFDGNSCRDFPSPSQEIGIGTTELAAELATVECFFSPSFSLGLCAIVVMFLVLAVVWKRIVRF